jgi:DUF971 family protein
MPASHAPRPTALSKDGDTGLAITWSDGHHSTYRWEHLRQHCPCATCREQTQAPADPFRILRPAEREPLKLVAMAAVGHYAYKFTWSDGHDTGIYTLENLRGLCQCGQCRPT